MRKALCLLLFAVTFPSFAADVDVLAFGTQTRPRNGDVFNVARENGAGAGVDVRWSGLFSTELAGSVTRSQVGAVVTPTGPRADFGRLRVMPLTATAQIHFIRNSRFDPYIGGGAAYVRFGDLHSPTLNAVSVDAITFKSRVAPVANAGLTIGLAPRLGLLLDAKYIPIKAKGTVRFTSGAPEALEMKLNPIIAAAGLRFRF